MIFKVLSMVVIGFLIYLVFFKKSREEDIVVNKKEEIEDDLVECPTCKTYISNKEAILSNGKHYCSKECIK